MSDKVIKLRTPLTAEKTKKLKSGDKVYLSGTIYTARDAAHARLIEAINNDEPLPFELKDQILYYVGPAPAKPGAVIGSAGPTTSYRMDDLTLPLLNLGLKGMIGKGIRSSEVIKGIKENKAIYFAAIGGAGALIADCIQKSEIIAYEDLKTEAIRQLEIKDMPLYVVIDTDGNNLYEIEREKFKRG